MKRPLFGTRQSALVVGDDVISDNGQLRVARIGSLVLSTVTAEVTPVAGDHGFPETAQLSVVRIGSLVLAAVPAEVTLVAGRELRTAMEEAAERRDWTPARTAIIGLANGYLQYVTTAKEYEQQDYEGGSTLYGPASSAFLARRLGELTAMLPRNGGAGSPPAQVVPITAYPGSAKPIMPLPAAGPDRMSIRLNSSHSQISYAVFCLKKKKKNIKQLI